MRLVALGLAAAALLGPALLGVCVACAQNYPGRVVRIIVPQPPGGGTDATARILAEKFRETFGQPFIIENKPGATGNIGIDYVAKSAPDGYTLLVVANNLTSNQLMFPKLPFDVVKDFAPIALLGSSPVILGGSVSLPANSLAELISYARAHPGKLTYASCGSGSPQHIAGEMLNAVARLDLVHVPFKGCALPIPDVIGARVDVAFNTLSNLRPHIVSGKIRAYAVTTAKRSSFAPDIPTFQESGIPGYDLDIWFGLLAPAGISREIVARLNAEVNKALASGDMREKLAAQFYEPTGGTPEQFADLIKQDLLRFGKVVRDANIRPE
jgi:tripartite-type tricarboxylate transporter receptor subunit TctC